MTVNPFEVPVTYDRHMVYRAVFSGLLALLAIRTRRHLFYKPIITLGIVYLIRFLTEAAVTGLDPTRFWAEVTITTIVAAPFLVTGMAIVTRMEQLHEQLANLAATDVLTDLPNRRAFMAEVEAALEGDRMHHLLIIDIDHFKRVNDTHGHAVGDMALIHVAHHLRKLSAPGEHIGRLGGEEFGMITTDRNTAALHDLGHALSSGVKFTPPNVTAPLELTVSIGATRIQSRDTQHQAFERADRALYQAKAAGRARMILCDTQSGSIAA